MRCTVNANVAGLGRRGETVEIDPALWVDYLEAGYLSPVDEHGQRAVAADAAAARGSSATPWDTIAVPPGTPMLDGN